MMPTQQAAEGVFGKTTSVTTPPARPAYPWWILPESLAAGYRLGRFILGAKIRARLDPGHRPANVPQDRVADIDYTRMPGAEHDVIAAWKRLHNGPDIVWTPRHGGHWIVTRADLIETLQTNAAHFSHGDVTLPKNSKPFSMLPLEADAPLHMAYRNIIMPALSPKAVNQLEASARQVTIELIDALQPRGGCEFVSDFAQRFPIAMFLRLVGLPSEDREKLLHYAHLVISGSSFQRLQGLIKMHFYLGHWSARRSRAPGGDIISRIATGKINGRYLTEREVHGLMGTVLFGGLDTMVSMLSSFTQFLATHPEHRRQLIETPELIPGAVDELLRRHGVACTSRVVIKDIELDGVTLKAGDRVMVANPLHGVDERRYPEPLEIIFGRPGAARHATFGNGPHRCAGALLARMELTVFLQEWLKRIPDFEITPGEAVSQASGIANGTKFLPIQWRGPHRQ